MIHDIYSQLMRDEGEKKVNGKHVAYQDHLGYWTIGIGRLIDERKGGGLSDVEVRILLENDVQDRIVQLSRNLDWFQKLDPARQGVLINMSFQLGVEGLLKFRQTLTHVEIGNYDDAAAEMLRSQWAEQTPSRAIRLSKQMAIGEWM